MSAGWQVGDLALCVAGRLLGGPSKAEIGCVYRVVDVIVIPDCYYDAGQTGLVLEGIRSVAGTGAFCPSRFRKIKPDTEPCEEEFTVLIKRGRKVQA